MTKRIEQFIKRHQPVPQIVSQLPLDLQAGDKVRLHSTGAYTTTFASVGFNGFDPLQAYYI